MEWKVDQTLSEIEGATSVDELVRILQRVAENRGFSAFSFVDGLRPGDDNPLILNTIAPAFNRDYRTEGFVHVDPIIPVWRRANTPFSWGSVPLPGRTGKKLSGALKTMRTALDHGYVEGLVVPFHYVDKIGRSYSSACTFFWTDKLSAFRTSIAESQAELHLILLYWAQRAVDLSAEKKGTEARFRSGASTLSLTDRERDVLSWAGRGKTSSETAEILGISPETAETHIRACLRKLNANNKTHAVVKAIYLRLIDI